MDQYIDEINNTIMVIGILCGVLALVGIILYRRRLFKVDSIRNFTQFFLIVVINFTVFGNMYIAPYTPVFRLDLPKLMARGSTRACPMWIIQKALTTSWELIGLIGVVAILSIICVVIGRAACGWACPFGLAQDMLNKARNALHIPPLEPPLKVHNKLKSIRFAVLFFILILAGSLGVATILNATTGTIFASYLPFGTTRTAPFCAYCPTPTVYYVASVIVGTGFHFEDPIHYAMWPIFLFLTGGPFLIPRFSCRYLCPQGAMTSLFNKVSLLHIHKDNPKCTKCNACYANCPMKVDIVQDEDVNERVSDTNCTFCGECIERCYERALSFRIGPIPIYKGGKSWEETEARTLSIRNLRAKKRKRR